MHRLRVITVSYFFVKRFSLFQQEEASTPQRVVLKRVSFKSTGMYRCEVTAVVRKKGFQGIQEIVMKESINRMTVVGNVLALLSCM